MTAGAAALTAPEVPLVQLAQPDPHPRRGLLATLAAPAALAALAAAALILAAAKERGAPSREGAAAEKRVHLVRVGVGAE